MNNEKNKFLTVIWLSGLLSAEIFISTGEWGVQMPPLTSENSRFLRSGPQEATLVMQFGFIKPGHSTTDAIFIVCQLQEKFYAVNKTVYMAFVNLENAFNGVPRRAIWWALCKLSTDEWLVRLIQSMYENARSRMHVGCNLSEEFSVKVGFHQGSCLSSLLFIMVLEALSQEFRKGCP